MENKAENKRPYMMILLLFIGYFMIYVDKTSIGLVAIQIEQDFNLSTKEMGYITGAFFLTYALCQIPAGWLNDRFGYKKVLLLSLGLSGIFAILFGGIGFSLGSLMLFRLMSGISHAGYPSASVKAVTLNFQQRERTFVQSILLSSAGLAFIAGPLIIGYLLENVGWRVPYLAIGVVELVIAVSILFYVPTKLTATSESSVAQTQKPEVSYWSLLKNPVVILMFIANLGLNIPAYGLMAWMPKYLIQVRGLDLSWASYLIALGGVAQWTASLCTGWFVGRYMQDREHIVIFIASLVSAVAIWCIYLSTDITTAALLIFIAYFFLMAAFVTTFTLPMKRLPSKVIGSGVGITNTGGTLGGFFAPVLIGHLIATQAGEMPNFASAFVFLAGGMVLTALAVLPLRKPAADKASLNQI